MRPGMYIGSTGQTGLHHLVYEIVDNAIDEALAGHCDQIEVIIEEDGHVVVIDNGRGIPVEKHPGTGLSTVETVLTTLHAGGKFEPDSDKDSHQPESDEGAYRFSGGLHGVGASVVNALSEELEVEVRRDGANHYQRYERGIAASKLTKHKNPTLPGSSENGTTIRFLPDSEIFTSSAPVLEEEDVSEDENTIMSVDGFDFEVLAGRFREMAYLTGRIRIGINDRRNGGQERWFYFDSGIKAFVQKMTSARQVLHPEPIVIRKKGKVECEVALQYTDSHHESVHSFVNVIRTADGGSHVAGFRSVLTKVLNNYAKSAKIIKESDNNLSGEDVREGLTAVIHVYHPNPQFEGQTKGKLGNPEVKGLVESAISDSLRAYLEQNPSHARKIVEKAQRAAQAREAARRARDLVQRKGLLEGSNLPGKLSDCSTKDPEQAEIYIVEGNSAGGTAKSARDRHTQAVLPLRGKVLNVEKARLDKMLKSEQIRNLITALGTGFGNEFAVDKLRYHKVVIMTDADVDGAHIRTLLLTFFFRHMPELIENGYLYIALPPLYMASHGRTKSWLWTNAERDSYLAQQGDTKVNLQRYKGLGEMNAEQLWDTTLNPETRSLNRVQVQDAELANVVFDELMGTEVPPRKAFIMRNAAEATLDI